MSAAICASCSNAADYMLICLCLGSPGGTQYDEKNIRRRVYDALNVLIAMEIISRSKKEILWHGLPSGHGNILERTRAEKIGLNAQIDKQQNYLQVLWLIHCSICLSQAAIRLTPIMLHASCCNICICWHYCNSRRRHCNSRDVVNTRHVECVSAAVLQS